MDGGWSGLVVRLALGVLLLGVAYREHRRGARGMAMICAGVTLTAVFGYVYHPPLLIAGIVLMLVGIWLTWVRKVKSSPSA